MPTCALRATRSGSTASACTATAAVPAAASSGCGGGRSRPCARGGGSTSRPCRARRPGAENRGLAGDPRRRRPATGHPRRARPATRRSATRSPQRSRPATRRPQRPRPAAGRPGSPARTCAPSTRSWPAVAAKPCPAEPGRAPVIPRDSGWDGSRGMPQSQRRRDGIPSSAAVARQSGRPGPRHRPCSRSYIAGIICDQPDPLADLRRSAADTPRGASAIVMITWSILGAGARPAEPSAWSPTTFQPADRVDEEAFADPTQLVRSHRVGGQKPAVLVAASPRSDALPRSARDRLRLLWPTAPHEGPENPAAPPPMWKTRPGTTSGSEPRGYRRTRPGLATPLDPPAPVRVPHGVQPDSPVPPEDELGLGLVLARRAADSRCGLRSPPLRLPPRRAATHHGDGLRQMLRDDDHPALR